MTGNEHALNFADTTRAFAIQRDTSATVMCCRGTLSIGRPSTVALQPELRSAVILSLCEGTTIEVSSTLLRANTNCLSDTYYT